MVKIAHLTSVHVPQDIRIFHKECKTLAAAGFDVVLIVPTDQSQSSQVIDGVRIISLPKPRNRRQRMSQTMWQLFRAALKERADVYHFHDPELMIVGILLKMAGRNVVYDVHEDIPRQIMTRHWIHPVLRSTVSRGVEALEAAGALIWDGIVAVTPTIAQRFPEHKRVLVQNFPVPEELMPERSIPYSERPPLVVYVGKLEAPRGATEMVSAMAEIPNHIDACLEIAGTFEPAGLEREIQNMSGWSRVRWLGWLTRPEIAELLGRARVGLVLLHPVDNYVDAQPNKLFEYMAAGIPVIASDFPGWRALIEDASCGLFVDPLDPAAISNAIQWLLEHPLEAEEMGKRGQETVLQRFTWRVEGEKLVQFYRTRFAG